MNRLFLYVFSAFPFLVFSQDGLPSEFESLTANYDRAVERATKPLKLKYIEELKKLRQRLSERGDLSEAIKVENRLKELGAFELTLEDLLFSKKWRYFAGKKRFDVKFFKDGTAELVGVGNWKWKIENELTLVVIYSDGNGITYQFRDLENLKATGRLNDSNALRTLQAL